MNGKLFVISAPSGAGKSSILAKLKPLFPGIRYSVSCTTRQPRINEVNGKDYYFITQEEFNKMIAAGKFFEWKKVHTNYYGTPVDAIQSMLEEGLSVLLDIDVQGAIDVFAKSSDAVGIFVNAPNRGELERRLRLRATDSDEEIRIRLENADGEMDQANRFKYQVTNDDLERAVKEIAEIITVELS